MRMKMALASALPFRPRLLVLDEPFNGLDPLIRDEFMENLLTQAGATTILISTHELADIENVATARCVHRPGPGRIQQTMDELTTRVREVHIQLGQVATLPTPMPGSWLQPKAVGNGLLSFIDTRFMEDELKSRDCVANCLRFAVSTGSAPRPSLYFQCASPRRAVQGELNMVWHFFKKDFRLLWPMALALAAAQALCAARTWVLGHFNEPGRWTP